MDDGHCLRWSFRRGTILRPSAWFDRSGFDVAPVDEARAKGFIVDHHDSGTYPAARRRHGLDFHGTLVGVAVFSGPQGAHAFKALGHLPGDRRRRLELSRFVERVARARRHPGKHRYAWALRPEHRPLVASVAPYPKGTLGP